MGVIASDTAPTNPTPDAGGAPEPSIAEQIAAYNASVDAPADVVDSATPAVVPPAESSTGQDPAAEGGDEPAAAADEPKKPDDKADADAAAEGGEAAAVVEPILFDTADTPEAVAEKKKAIIEAFPALAEEAPEIKALIDHQEAEIATLREATATLAALPNKETVIELGSAIKGLYEGAEIDPATGVMQVNAGPLVSALQTKLADEFRPIAEAIFATDSKKYAGNTLFEELLVDTFGPDKASRMVAYAKANTPLPVIPAELQLPPGIEEKNKEAFWSLKETKRFEINELVNDIARLESELETATPYYKETLAATLQEKRDKLSDEIFAVESIQNRYDTQRQTEATTQRQQIEAAQQFHAQVETVYQTELATMAEAFAQDLAPKLTYADADTQLSQARNILARVNNALSFIINPDGRLTDDPMADFYAKQLAEEGLQADFKNARELLKQHYNITRTLEALKIRKASPQAIEVWEGKRSNVMFELKGQQRALLGQLSAKYSNSSVKALEKQIDEVKGQKQAARTITRGKPVAKAQPKPVKDEIAEYNRKVDQAIRNGDDLYAANAG